MYLELSQIFRFKIVRFVFIFVIYVLFFSICIGNIDILFYISNINEIGCYSTPKNCKCQLNKKHLPFNACKLFIRNSIMFLQERKANFKNIY